MTNTCACACSGIVTAHGLLNAHRTYPLSPWDLRLDGGLAGNITVCNPGNLFHRSSIGVQHNTGNNTNNEVSFCGYSTTANLLHSLILWNSHRKLKSFHKAGHKIERITYWEKHCFYFLEQKDVDNFASFHNNFECIAVALAMNKISQGIRPRRNGKKFKFVKYVETGRTQLVWGNSKIFCNQRFEGMVEMI